MGNRGGQIGSDQVSAEHVWVAFDTNLFIDKLMCGFKVFVNFFRWGLFFIAAIFWLQILHPTHNA